MKNSVSYNESSIEVQDPKKDNVVVYAHPGDKITLDFDISSLKKELVNGDLVIRTQSGGTVTIANYSIMYMQNLFPVVTDSLSQEYDYYDFLGNVNNLISSDNPDSIIIDRVISSPKAGVNSGDYLATGREFILDNYAIKELVGMIDVDEQHPILANDVYMNPYNLLTLYQTGVAKYDIPVTFRYAGRTILNQEEPSTLPVVTRNSNPKSAPIYGAKQEFFTPGEGVAQAGEVRSSVGGGEQRGNEYSDYMFSAGQEHINYSTQSSSLYYKAYNGNEIVRGINLYLTDANTIFQSIILQDVPQGVTFITSDNTEVQPLGSGSFLVTPKITGNSINLYFKYNEKNAIDSYGNPIGMKEIMQQVRVSIEGYNAKYEQLVIGNTEVTFDFREVHSERDVNNFSLYNTYTFSTLFDPITVSLTRFSDRVDGGVADTTYELLEGDDYFKGGSGNDTVYMGEGNDTYVYSFGNDVVDGKANINNVDNPQITGTDVLRFDHENYIDKNGNSLFSKINLSLSNGEIKVFNSLINHKGKADNSTSVFKNFDELYLEEETGVSADQDNTITIGDTSGFRGLKIFSGGSKKGDTLKLDQSSLLDFMDEEGGSVTSSLKRNNPLSVEDFNRDQKIYFAPEGREGKDRFTNIVGSKGNDYFLASETKDYNLKFDGKEGTNTADFSNVVLAGVTYDANNGKAVYGLSEDTLLNINIFIGTVGDDIVYGSGIGNLIVYGIDSKNAAVRSDNNLVSYSNFQGVSGKGVVIDYTKQGYIEVTKYGRGVDKLYSVDTVEASQADDIFILSYMDGYTVDGLQGKNDTIDYSKNVVSSGITVNITGMGDYGAEGNVEKGANSDKFSNINGVIGTISDDIFLISGSQEGDMSYDGKAGYNTIDYSGTTDLSINYDLTNNELKKFNLRTNTEKYKDKVNNFSEIIGTDNDDQFIATDKSWESKSDIVYNGGNSTIDISKDITESNGKLVNAGDVLFLNYNLGNINLGLIEVIFKNFDTLRLGNYNNTIEYGNSSFINFWGGNLSDTFDASTNPEAVTYEIKGNSVGIDKYKLYNFDTLKGSDAGTTFRVTLDANKLNANYRFEGGQSLDDTLDYSGTTEKINLVFDLGSLNENDEGSVTKGNSGNKDTFVNIETFVGGEGDDTFYLNPFNTSYKIDGKGGNNTISFKNYSTAVNDSDIPYANFVNINSYELTELDDSWLISSDTESIKISGGKGIDTINIGATVDSVHYEIDDKMILNVNGNKHTLSSFEILYGANKSHAGSSDKVDMKVDDNTKLVDDESMYFILNNAVIDYSSLKNGVTLDIYNPKVNELGLTSEMSITKSKGFDYYSGVKEITLTSKSDLIKLDVSNPDTFSNLKIDAGDGIDTIDLSGSSSTIIYDSQAKTVNDIQFNVINWEIMKTGDGDDIFKLSSTDRNLIIDAGLGENVLDLSKIAENLTVDFIEDTDKINVTAGSEKIVDSKGIKKVIGGSSNNTFKGSSADNYTIDGTASSNNILDYSSSQDNSGFSFSLSSDDNSSIIKGSSGNMDTIKNIQHIIGTKKDDTFVISSDSKIQSVNGGGGRNEILVDVIGGATQGFNFDLDNNILSGGGLKENIIIKDFQVLNGSDKDDVFTVTNESVLTEKGEIRGGDGSNTLNAKIKNDSGQAVDLYLDLARGFIYKKNDNNTPSADAYMSIQGINTVNLGDGKNIFVFTGSLPDGNYTVDLGSGSENLLSFKDINYALSGTYQEMIETVTSGSPVTIKGKYGLQLTQYDDYLKIAQSEDSIFIDGSGGNDVADYAAVSDNMVIDLTKGGDSNQMKIQRGSKEDTLMNFEKFILGAGQNTVTAGSRESINIDGGGNALISYENLTGGVIAQLDRGTVLKKEYNTADLISGFNVFKDSKGDDIIYAFSDYKEIWGSYGNDILNLSKISGAVVYQSNSSATSISASSGSIAIKNGNGSTEDNSFKTIVFGDNNATVSTGKIEGRTYIGKTGFENELNYHNLTSGIEVDFSVNTVKAVSGDDESIDTFSYFNKVTGTDKDDRFIGLSTSSHLTIDAGGGDDTISFTGSTSALIVDVKEDGTIDSGASGIKINKTSGSLSTGGTKHDDIFYINKLETMDKLGGIDGEGGLNTLSFEKITNSGVNKYDIGVDSTYNFKIKNIQRYIFTGKDDHISWTVKADNFTTANFIDFGGGTDDFTVDLNSVSNGMNIVYQIEKGNGNLSLASSSYSKNLSLLGLEKLILKSSQELGSFKASFKGEDYTNSSDIFGTSIDLNGALFSKGVFFEFKDYILPSFDTSTIIANVTDISFLGSKNGNVMDLQIKDSSNQKANVNIKIFDKVNITVDKSVTLPIVLNADSFTVQTSATNTQTFNIAKINQSTLNMGNQLLKVEGKNILAMPSVINIKHTEDRVAGIDFSNYSGQHGVWNFSNNVLTGSLANDITVNFDYVQSKMVSLKLTATNDLFSISQDRSSFKNSILIDGEGGENTFLLSKSTTTNVLAGVTSPNKDGSGGELIVVVSQDSAVIAGAVGGDDVYSNADFKNISNFSIFDARGEGVNKDMSNRTIINVILSPDSSWTDIYMPYAKDATSSQDTMQRTILNASGYDSTGTGDSIQGGFNGGGTYVVSFEDDPKDSSKLNRMMQVEAKVKNGATERLFNVHNVQSIYGRAGEKDTVIFKSINTEQFKDLVHQMSQDKAVISGSNVDNAKVRSQYLYLDLDFRKDISGSSNNNIAKDPGSIDKYDVIDFSSWDVNDSSKVYDMALSGLRGGGANNGLHMFALGAYREDSSVNAMLAIKASGYQHIILPQTKFYFNLNTAYFKRTFVLEFPDIQDTSLYATYDAANGNYQVVSYSLFSDIDGTTSFSNNNETTTLINFTTFFLAQTDSGQYKAITANIGKDFADSGLFNSNNVYLYFDQTIQKSIPPTSSNRSNNEDQVSGGKSQDVIDFSSIDSGVYYYSRGAWVDREHKSHDFVSADGNTGRKATADYTSFLTDTNTGVGLIFTNDYSRDKVGSMDGLDKGTNAFYRIQGANIIKLTNATNTYALGEVYWSGTQGQGPVGALVNADKKTHINTVEGGIGVDTFLDNSFGADTQKSGGGAQSGNVMDNYVWDTTSQNIYKPFNNFYFMLTGKKYYSTLAGQKGSLQDGHIERVYIMDSKTNSLDMRMIASLEDTYGKVKNAMWGAGNPDALKDTSPGSDRGDYASEFARTTYKNFEKIVIDDYAYDSNGDALKSGATYLGVQDNVTVRGAIEKGNNIGKYREFDLGGRYRSSEASGKTEQQKVFHEITGKEIKMQFVNSIDEKTDTSVVFSDGWNGSKYTSYYGYKNWDLIEVAHTGVRFKNFNMIFNTSFDFNKMANKEFDIYLIDTYPGVTTLNAYFQSDRYGYTVEKSGIDANLGFSIFTVESKDGASSFTIRVFHDTGITSNFEKNATDDQIGDTLTKQELQNLEEYGYIDGEHQDENPFLDDSLDDGSNGIGSYGRNTMNNNEEDQGESIAYTDGSSGMTSFGRGSRSLDARTTYKSSDDEDKSKAESETTLPKAEEQWFKDEDEEDNNNYSDDTVKEDAEDEDNNYSDDTVKEDAEDEDNNDNPNPNDDLEQDKSEDGLHDDAISFLEGYQDALNQENDIDNINFTDFTEKNSDFNMDDLFNKSEDLLSNNIELNDSLNEMVETVNSVDEEAVNTTNQMDELDSMSFALDSMFNIDDSAGSVETSVDNNNKNKNNNNFSNS